MKNYNNEYVPIHLHTAEGSLRDSILMTNDLVKKAKEIGLKSLCITDHGSLSNMYNFYYECINNNIKPIIGCEIYFCEDMTLKDKEHKMLAFNRPPHSLALSFQTNLQKCSPFP